MLCQTWSWSPVPCWSYPPPSSNQELTVEKHNLLLVTYKIVISAHCVSWRIVSSLEQREGSKGHKAQVSIIKCHGGKIEIELTKICEDILDALDKHLIWSAASGEYWSTMSGKILGRQDFNWWGQTQIMLCHSLSPIACWSYPPSVEERFPHTSPSCYNC